MIFFIKCVFWGRIWSGMGWGYSGICLKAMLCVCHTPQALFLSGKQTKHVHNFGHCKFSNILLSSYFLPVGHVAGAVCFSGKLNISRIWDMTISQKG